MTATPITVDRGLKKAITAAGRLRELARRLHITHAAIRKWQKPPAGRIIEIERVTGVQREELRPDLYRRTSRVSVAATDSKNTHDRSWPAANFDARR
jgi:DNA-binding transcriptional regulator YdaS (Cro superfamily)